MAWEKLGSVKIGSSLGTSANGTNSGATYQTSVKKFGSGSFRFVASDPDWVDLGNNFTGFQTGDISYSFWFRVDSTSGTQGLLSKDFTSHTSPYYTFSNRTEGSDSTDYKMNVAGNDAGAYDGDENKSANGSISANTWHNWIVTQSVSGSGTQTAYLDGTAVGTALTKKPSFYSTNWYLGRMGNFSDGSNALTGYMQDVCFWNKVIPASTISALQTTQVKSLSDKTGIKAYYPLDVAPVSNVVINEDPASLEPEGDVMTVSGLEAKKHLMVQVAAAGTGGTVNCNLTFNSDTGNNYAIRESVNGGSDFQNVSLANSDNLTGTVTGNVFATIYILNEASKEKLFISEGLENASGAGNAPERKELVGKWANTSNAITVIKANNSGSGNFAEGSEITVYGTD